MRRDVNQKKKKKDMKRSSVMNHDLHLVVQCRIKTGRILVTNAPTCRNVFLKSLDANAELKEMTHSL